jgi:hypothetical protein
MESCGVAEIGLKTTAATYFWRTKNEPASTITQGCGVLGLQETPAEMFDLKSAESR